jgi:hypothetical protein
MTRKNRVMATGICPQCGNALKFQDAFRDAEERHLLRNQSNYEPGDEYVCHEVLFKGTFYQACSSDCAAFVGDCY